MRAGPRERRRRRRSGRVRPLSPESRDVAKCTQAGEARPDARCARHTALGRTSLLSVSGAPQCATLRSKGRGPAPPEPP
ncbi:hypothetical protein P7K49_013981 [Saguinus oedipus]|uniref:Uncharacterized protein n=1 Tax=Saguinus oedipus TaxID=9490 RepID=A0ABQ9VI23_SAGOE|nr:hypothetical protein P7K49_013981 [Saguinus oedipus]